MPTISSLLTHHHSICDQRLESLTEAVEHGHWDAANERFAALHAELARHIQLEEDVLFPAFERASGTTEGPTAVMRTEHTRIASLLGQLAAAIDRRDTVEYRIAQARFHTLMVDHNRKEEQILYPACDRLLQRDLDALVEQSKRALVGAPPVPDDLVVDACWLQPPEPMEKVVAALERLQPGQRVRFLIHREPMPLYRMLQQNDYRWRTAQREDGVYEIMIWAA